MYAFTALECFKLRNCWVLNLPSDNFSLWPEPKGCQSCCTSALPYLASLALHLLFSVKNDVLPNCLWFGICTHRSNLENDSGTSESNLFDLNFSNNVWFKAPLPNSKIDFGPGTFKSHEIFRICWDCSGEAMIKFSAQYHDVFGRYSSN